MGPVRKARRMYNTWSCLFAPDQQYQIIDLFVGEERVAVEVTSSAYQNIIEACRAPDMNAGRVLKRAEINTVTSRCVPSCLT